MVCSEETERIRKRYQRRSLLQADIYDPMQPYVYMGQQEKERALIKMITEAGLRPVADKRTIQTTIEKVKRCLILCPLPYRI